MNVVLSMLVSNVVMLLVFLGIFYRSWLDSFRPDWFYIFRIYRNDYLNFDEHKLFLPFRGKKNEYILNGTKYSKKDFKPYIDSKGVYTWNFKEGEMLPITFKKNYHIDGKLYAEANKMTLDNIWFANNGIEEFIRSYGALIIGGIVIALLVFMLQNNTA